MKELLQNLAMSIVDRVMAMIPRALPDDAALRNCKIISHRGEHDNRTVMENTLLAFDIARAAGVWGVECDIRWTKDNVPVICHDASTERVFGKDIVIDSVEFADLRAQLPAVPTLEEVVARYSGNTHLMLELKSDPAVNLDLQRRILQKILGNIIPKKDFHVLSLEPELFVVVSFLEPDVLLPVAQTNTSSLSRLSLERNYCGLAGHYLMLGEKIRRKHHAAGQVIGTGFPSSRNCLLREINRGVEWIFSNDAVFLQGKLDAMRASLKS
ncbi:MAG: glycerophosphodiester phosphodiesterase family protein [Halioglobus sp.]